MNAQPYARCVQCSLPYLTQAAVQQTDRCPRCGNNMRVLNPKDDVLLSPGYRSNLREVAALALVFAQQLAKQPNQIHAPKAISAIAARIRSSSGNAIKVNWHELQLLGWWSTQGLQAKVTWTPEKLMGTAKRITLFLWELEQAFPQRAGAHPLSRVTHLSKDQVEKFFQEGPGAQAEGEDRALSTDDIHQFPKIERAEGTHALDAVHKTHQLKGLLVDGLKDRGPQTLYDTRGGVLKVIKPAAEDVPAENQEKVHFFTRRGPMDPWEPGCYLLSDPGMDWIHEGTPVLCCPTCSAYFTLQGNPVLEDGIVEKPVICPGPAEGKSCTFHGKVRLLGWIKPEEKPNEI